MNVNRCANCMEETQTCPCPRCGFDPARSPQPEYALPRNTILHGKFLVGNVLGQGGFGITYVGWDLALEVKVAIKEYYPAGQVIRQTGTSSKLQWSGTAQGEEARREGMESFLREARKMARVYSVPQVVRVRDTFYENDTAYIIMDFVKGETLKARLEREGPMSFDRAMKIFRPAISAMEQVHREGLIHRDLSPDNIMIEPGGGVRILDLGAAKDMAVNHGASSVKVAKGGFSPFEQYSERGASGPWSDVYAMAATIYYTLTGTVPPSAIDRIDQDELRWDHPALRALPAPALAALQRALAVTARSRTQSMHELLLGLEQPVPGPEPRYSPGPAPRSKPRPNSQNKLPVIAGACAALVLVLAVIPVVLSRNRAHRPSQTPAPTTEVMYTPSPTSGPAAGVESVPPNAPGNVIAGGEAGASVTWTLDDTGLMTLSGSGKTDDFQEDDSGNLHRPWEDYKYDIKAAVVEPGVTGLGGNVFYGCSKMTGVTLPEGLTSIGDSAFRFCDDLTGITLPESVTSIGKHAFGHCDGLTGITLPESVTSIGEFAFSGCEGLTGITLPKNVTKIGNFTFDGCKNLTSITLPEGLRQIGSKAFSDCTSLTGIALPEGLTEIGMDAFWECTSLASVTLPEGLTKIYSHTFYNCTSLTSITLPEGLTEIDTSAFSDCTGLTDITLPESLTKIGGYAFWNCAGLSSVRYAGTEAQWSGISIGNYNDKLLNANILCGS